jgi:hypothetical protein
METNWTMPRANAECSQSLITYFAYEARSFQCAFSLTLAHSRWERAGVRENGHRTGTCVNSEG